MVSISQIRASNSSITSPPRTALFAGATSGIGKETLASLVHLKTPIKIYLLGRKETAPKIQPFLDDLRNANPNAEIIWLEAELSLLAEAKRVAEEVKRMETRLDVLCLSIGYAPFGGRKETKEGLETSQALGYYARLLLLHHLLPILRASPTPRVLTIFGGPMLSELNTGDLNLTQPGAFSAMQSQKNMVTMTTLSLEHLAEDAANRKVSLIHSYPGFVGTGNIKRGWGRGSWKSVALDVATRPVLWAVGRGVLESGERGLFLLTSGRFGGGDGERVRNSRGGEEGGLFLVDEFCEVEYKEELLEKLREGAKEVVWQKTREILEPYM